MENFIKNFGSKIGWMKVVMVVVGMLFCIDIAATNYYIAPSGTGNDANNGTAVGTPKLTLKDVFNDYNLGSGDIIYVAAGTYTEKGITMGSDDEGFIIQGAALDASGNPTSIFDSDQTDSWLYMTRGENDNIKIS